MMVVVTGASGFLGTRFREFNKDKYESIPVSLIKVKPSEIDLNNVNTIVHMAVVAHDEKKVNHEIQYSVNYELTKQLADHAKKMNVPHFVFISTAKVYGGGSMEWLDESSACHPLDAYGKSKYQAEEYLRSIQTDHFKVAIIRPPLVYGPGVKGNMLRILKLAEKNILLPFGNSNNQRSIVFVDNLVELINRIIDEKASGIFIAGDAKPISTEELLTLIRSSMNKRRSLVSIPSFFKMVLKKLKPELFNRLFGSFVIDNSGTNSKLKFVPPYSTEFGIRKMVDWYCAMP